MASTPGLRWCTRGRRNGEEGVERALAGALSLYRVPSTTFSKRACRTPPSPLSSHTSTPQSDETASRWSHGSPWPGQSHRYHRKTPRYDDDRSLQSMTLKNDQTVVGNQKIVPFRGNNRIRMPEMTGVRSPNVRESCSGCTLSCRTELILRLCLESSKIGTNVFMCWKKNVVLMFAF